MAKISYTDSLGVNHWPNAYNNSNKIYGIDWSQWLTQEGSTISSVLWTVPAGITSSNESINGNIAQLFLNPTVAGTYTIRCKITDSLGQDKIEDVELVVSE